MLKIIRCGLCMIIALLCMQSCVDNDYDIDDFNKDAEFLIPPVPIGNVDTFWVDILPPGTIPPGITIPSLGNQIVKEQTIQNLFTEDILDKFFYEDANADVKLESKVDIDILGPSSGIEIDVIVQVIDYDEITGVETVNTHMKVPNPQTLRFGKNQKFDIVFPVQYFKYMENARDLKMIIVMKANNIFISENDYFFIKDVVLKSGGLHFKF